MRKTSYKEVLEILKQNKTNKTIYEEAFNELECIEIGLEYDTKKVKEALEQAQKQEKLFELYRELDGCIVAPYGHHVCRYTDDEKYSRIRKKIKELEK